MLDESLMAFTDAADEQKALQDSSDPRHTRAVAVLEQRLLGEEAADQQEGAVEIDANAPATSFEFENITLPHGEQHDAEFNDMVGSWMNEIGLPDWVGHSLFQIGATIDTEPTPESIAQQTATTESALRKKWGDSYDDKISDVQTLLSGLPDEALAFLDASGLGSDQRLIETLSNYVEMQKR